MFTSHRLERHMKCWSDCMVFTSKNEKKSTVSNQYNPLLSIWYKVGFATAVPSVGKFNRDKKGKAEAKQLWVSQLWYNFGVIFYLLIASFDPNKRKICLLMKSEIWFENLLRKN